MSREAFEKWYLDEYETEFGQDYRNDDVIEKGFIAGYQAATEAAKQPNELGFVCGACDGEIELDGQEYCEHCLLKRITELEAAQQWTPYKEGDVVEDGEYLAQFRNGQMQVIERDESDWLDDEGDKIAGIAVAAYRPLPPAFNGDAV